MVFVAYFGWVLVASVQLWQVLGPNRYQEGRLDYHHQRLQIHDVLLQQLLRQQTEEAKQQTGHSR